MPARAAFIVLAAGSSHRFDGNDKVFAELGGRPVLGYALEAAQHSTSVSHVVVVCNADQQERVWDIAATELTTVGCDVVSGGSTRQGSEVSGLEALSSLIGAEEIDVVAIHDGARPFATAALIDDLVETALRTGTAVPGLEPTDAIWSIDEHGELLATEKRRLRAVQTPQACIAKPLLDAYRAAAEDGFDGADTAATIAAYAGLPITIVDGDPRNIKITFPDDLERAQPLAAHWRSAAWLS